MRLLRKLGGIAAGLLVLLLCASAGHAQDAGTTGRASAGDVLKVDVEGRADITGSYTIDKNGDLMLPVLGRVAAAGRTTSDLGTDIARRMSLISNKITQVSVLIMQSASRRNYVLGAVLLPGMYVFREPPTVWEAIAEAGGPAEDADLSVVEVFSESQPKPTIVDVTSAATGDLSKLPRLRAGDTVRVPRRGRAAVGGQAEVVYVFGAVGTQGPVTLAAAPDLVSAFIRTGPSPEVDYKRVEIVRRTGPRIVRMSIHMDEYFERGDISGNPSLEAGDTIRFRRLPSKFSPLRIVGGLASVLALVTSITYLSRR
jgi:polysaccharide export outer membrane protein